jgi:predicted AAA+ superfamily ATPase
VSLAALFDGGRVAPSASALGIGDAIQATARGGWPQAVGYPAAPSLLVAAEYVHSLAESEIVAVDGTRRSPAKARALLRSLARNNATSVSIAEIGRDIGEGDEPLSKPTVLAYLGALRRLYVIEEIPGWGPQLKSKARLRAAPKRVFADPSLAAAAIGATPEKPRATSRCSGRCSRTSACGTCRRTRA